MVYLLGSTIYRNRRTGLYAALLYLSSAQLVHQAQTVRMYTMLGFLAAVSLLLWVRIFVQQNRSRWITAAYVVLNFIGMLTQVWFFFILFSQFLSMLFLLPRGLKKFVPLMALSGLTFVGFWGRAFLNQLHNGSTNWIPPFHPIFLLDILTEFYGAQGMGLLLLVACGIPLLYATRPVRLAFWREHTTRVLVTTFLACILAPMAVSVVKPIYFPGRYSTVALPALAVLLGAVLTRVAPRRYAALVCYGMLIVTAASHIRNRNVVGDGGLPPGHSDRATAEYILQHAAAGDYVVFTNLNRAAADYYFRRYGAERRFVEISFPAELDQHAGWLDRAAMLRHPNLLGDEAGQVAGRLQSAARKGSAIWVYNGLAGVSEVLESRLDSTLTLAERYDLRGPFHREVLRYR